MMQSVRKLFTVLLALVLTVSLAGCGINGVDQTSVSNAEKQIKIALVLPSGVDDLAWSQSMTEALKAVQQQSAGKVQIAISEKLSKPDDAGAAIRQYATQGYDIIIAHGSQYQAVVSQVAKDFPKTTFAYGSGTKTGANIFAYDPQAQEGGYLLGIIAAKMTKSNTVGIIGPVESGDAVKYNSGFKQGVEKTNPNVKVRIAYTGSFSDVTAAGDLAKADMKAGADFLTGSSQQAVGAVRAAVEKPGTYWLSTDYDQTAVAPTTVLASQTYNWEKVIQKIINFREKEGVLGGQELVISFAEGNIDLKFNPQLAKKVPQDVKDAVEKAKKDIISGQIKIQLPTAK